MRELFKSILKVSFSLGLLLAIFYFVDIGKIIESIRRANSFYIILAFFSYLSTITFLTLAWKFSLGQDGHKFSNIYLLKVNWASSFLSLVTPSQIGQLGKFLFLSEIKGGIERGKAFASVIVMKGAKTLLRLPMIVVWLVFFFGSYSQYIFSLLVASFLINALLVSVFIFLPYFSSQKIEKFLFKLPDFANIITKIKDLFMKCKNEIRKILKNYFPKVLLVTGLGLILINAITAWLVFKSIAVEISFLILIVSIPVIYSLNILPISLGGVGVIEGGTVVIFSAITNIPPHQLAAFALVWRGITFYFYDLIGGIILWRMGFDFEDKFEIF